MTVEELKMQQKNIPQKIIQPELGDKVPSPEIGVCWDPLERWEEVGRWKWDKDEHNNILEARATAVAVKMATMEVKNWDKRHLMISDSQVVIGCCGKGRSSRPALNRVIRRIASSVLVTGCKLYYRYVRTHRNHADGPSRGFPLGVAPKEEDEDWMQDLLVTTKG